MYDDLYKSESSGANPWFTTISPECREWLEGLADHVAEHGEPVWRQVHKRIRELFPDDAPKAENTAKDAVRKLVADRG